MDTGASLIDVDTGASLIDVDTGASLLVVPDPFSELSDTEGIEINLQFMYSM